MLIQQWNTTYINTNYVSDLYIIGTLIVFLTYTSMEHLISIVDVSINNGTPVTIICQFSNGTPFNGPDPSNFGTQYVPVPDLCFCFGRRVVLLLPFLLQTHNQGQTLGLHLHVRSYRFSLRSISITGICSLSFFLPPLPS